MKLKKINESKITKKRITVQCDCGSDSFEIGTILFNNKRLLDCGCSFSQSNQIIDLRTETLPNKIKAIRPVGKGSKTLWLFECNCENNTKFVTQGTNVSNHSTKSCGCKIKYESGRNGESTSYIFQTYNSIIQRCTNPNYSRYDDYGGRGITIHQEWLEEEGYNKFKKYIIENIGERPSNMTLDRIDNNQGYIPGNLKWSSYQEQNRNRRNSKLSQEQVDKIRELIKIEKSEEEIANLFKVSKSTINDIKKGRRWQII